MLAKVFQQMEGAMQRREVSLFRLALRQHVWVLLLPLAIGLVFGAVALSEGAKAQRLAQQGAVAMAEVIDRQAESRRDSEGRTQWTYYLTYRFDLPGGVTQTTRESVGQRFYNSVQRGDRLPVTYLPEDPGLSEIEPGSRLFLSRVFGAVSILLLAVSMGGGAWFWKRSAKILRAARHGEVREARVLSHEETNVSVNKRRMWRLHWRDATGSLGRSGLHRLEELAPHPSGSVIVVYVDPESGQAFWEEEIAPMPVAVTATA